MTQPVFLYDGDCAVCSTCARFIERRLRPRATVIAWQFTDLAALGVRREAAAESVQWVGPTGVTAGPVAIADLLRDSRWWWRPFGLVLATRPVLWLAWPAYRWIARNRHRLPGGTPVCSLPPSARPSRP